MSKTKLEKSTGCWLWKGYRDKKGYGQVRHHGRAHWAHRVAYAIFNGCIPDGMTIHHTCHNPGCVNPEHLTTATVAENAKERYCR
jgi:hypothetical protein